MGTLKLRSARRRRTRDGYAAVRRLLLRRRDELLAQVHGELDDSRLDNVGARFDDVADRASDALYSELAQGVAEIATADLHKIDHALERIADRSYGTCEECGKPIPKARLRMLPFADRCVRCQQELEHEVARGPYQYPDRDESN